MKTATTTSPASPISLFNIKKMQTNIPLVRFVFDNAIEGIVITNKEGVILYSNKALTRSSLYEEKELLGNNVTIFHSNQNDETFYQNMWKNIGIKGHWSGEICNQNRNGDLYNEWLEITAIKDEKETEVLFYIAKYLDFHHCKKISNKLQFLSHHDPLTELANRVMLDERLDYALLYASRTKKNTAILFIDIDVFKEVNDMHGHHTGDLLLVSIAKRLSGIVRKTDTVARIGGDEFVILLIGINGLSEAEDIAEKVTLNMDYKFPIEGKEIYIGASTGVSIAPADSEDGRDLIAYADIAMYEAKNAGGHQHLVYKEMMREDKENKSKLMKELNNAIRTGELLLHYQPQYNINTGKMTGVEALVRWNHPERGLLQPSEFLPAAEDNQLIIDLGQWVLKKACGDMRDIFIKIPHSSISDDGFRCAINISAKHFQRQGFVSELKEVLSAYPISEHIELEITEQTLVEDTELMIEKFNEIVDMDVCLAIDDFGTGYSSMSYLQKFPIGLLKIDRSFINDIESPEDEGVLIKTVVQLGHNLGMKVLAEGVETDTQRQFLKNIDCDIEQGFLAGKPVPLKDLDLLNLLKSYSNGNSNKGEM